MRFVLGAVLHLAVFGICLLDFARAVWWSLGTQIPLASDPAKKAMMCLVTPELNLKQKQQCQRYPDLMPHVAKGAKHAVHECQFQFRARRWNCSGVPESGSLFGMVMNKGNREAAFISAITSAGVAHAVTSACSSGELSSCDCDRSKAGNTKSGWTWVGCNSNVKFGTQFAQNFVDVRERGNSPRAVMNRHNNRAGRKALAELLYKKCKCHGLSGSCSMKTCWMQQPPFRQVGNYLKSKYDSANRMIVKLNRRGKKRLKPKSNKYKKPSENDLIYYEKSPSYCDAVPAENSIGTRQRQCNVSSSGIDGCELLCCGRGHNIQQAQVTRNCNCIFKWCCRVICDKCKERINIYTCK